MQIFSGQIFKYFVKTNYYHPYKMFKFAGDQSGDAFHPGDAFLTILKLSITKKNDFIFFPE